MTHVEGLIKLNNAFKLGGKFDLTIIDESGHRTSDTTYFPEAVKKIDENTEFLEEENYYGFMTNINSYPIYLFKYYMDPELLKVLSK